MLVGGGSVLVKALIAELSPNSDLARFKLNKNSKNHRKNGRSSHLPLDYIIQFHARGSNRLSKTTLAMEKTPPSMRMVMKQSMHIRIKEFANIWAPRKIARPLDIVRT